MKYMKEGTIIFRNSPYNNKAITTFIALLCIAFYTVPIFTYANSFEMKNTSSLDVPDEVYPIVWSILLFGAGLALTECIVTLRANQKRAFKPKKFFKINMRYGLCLFCLVSLMILSMCYLYSNKEDNQVGEYTTLFLLLFMSFCILVVCRTKSTMIHFVGALWCIWILFAIFVTFDST